MGPKKGKGPPPPPPEEIHLFYIKNFAIVETKETSLSLTPTTVLPAPEKKPQIMAAEEDTTCGKMRMRIELNEQGCPDYQIKWVEEGDHDPKVRRECEELVKPKPGQKKETPTFNKEEHGLPHIKAAGWLKEPMTFPALKPKEEAPKKKRRRRKKKLKGKDSKGKKKRLHTSPSKSKKEAMKKDMAKKRGLGVGITRMYQEFGKDVKFEPITLRKIVHSFTGLVPGKNLRNFTSTRNQRATHFIEKNHSTGLIEPCRCKDSKGKNPCADWTEKDPCSSACLTRTMTRKDCTDLLDRNPCQCIDSKQKLSHNSSIAGDLCRNFPLRNKCKNFIVFPAAVNFENVNETPTSTKPTGDVSQEPNPLGYDTKTQADFASKPFVVSDIVGNEFIVDPRHTKRDGNYYIVTDTYTGDVLVIEPPKMVVLDPLTQRELVIDPNKPVGQNFWALSSAGTPITMNTYDKQPYIFEDSVTGARLLKDNTRVKAYSVIDPQSEAEVRINPLKADGRPYSYRNSAGRTFSIVPVVPGSTPILFEHPTTGETSILGGPVMIRDPKSGQMQYQEGPFTMRNPKNGQNINQIGPIMKRDPKTEHATVMANPRYVKNPKTGELILEPPVMYHIQDSGKIIVTSPEVDNEATRTMEKGKRSSGYEKKLGPYKVDGHEIELEHGRSTEFSENEGNVGINEVAEKETILAAYRDSNTPDGHYARDDSSNQEFNSKEYLRDDHISKKITQKLEVPTMDQLLNRMSPEHRKYLLRTLDELKVKEQMAMRSLIAKKKQVERCFLQTMLIQKEQKQNLFIQTLSEYFQYTRKNYNKIMFAKYVQDRLNEENENLVRLVNEKIGEENNLALDAMLINIEKQKVKVLAACNPKGTPSEYAERCDLSSYEPCRSTVSENTNKGFVRAMVIYKIFRKTLMDDYENAIERENALIRKEMSMSLEKEMAFIAKNIEKLYLKVTCGRFLAMPQKKKKDYCKEIVDM
ncbi:hypothetical protein WDU94_008611 [Cyamophila willieti]